MLIRVLLERVLIAHSLQCATPWMSVYYTAQAPIVSVHCVLCPLNGWPMYKSAAAQDARRARRRVEANPRDAATVAQLSLSESKGRRPIAPGRFTLARLQ